MNNTKLLSCICFFVLLINTAWSQNKNVELPGTRVLKFKSMINDQDYVLAIALPDSYGDTSMRYPVLYTLDGQWTFPLFTAIHGGLRYDGLAPEMIIVGITWPDNYDINRSRDFSPTHIKDDLNSGGAPKFLSVIKNEIIKLIDSSFPSDKKNNTLSGGSAGGLFALYALFQDHSPFNRYIISSPSVEYDNQAIFAMEKTFAAKNHSLDVKLFINSTEYEEMGPDSYFKKFIDQLGSRKYKGFEMESLVVEKMSHASGGPYAMGRGLEFVFSTPEPKIDSKLLDQYAGNYEQGVIITRAGESIYINIMGGNAKLYAETKERFYLKGMRGKGEFKKDSQGKVTGYNVILENASMFFKKLD